MWNMLIFCNFLLFLTSPLICHIVCLWSIIFVLKTSQELRMLSSVTINCQVTKIVMNSGSQLSEMSTMSLLVIVGIELFQLCVWLSSLLVMAFGWISLSLIECHHSQVAFTTLIKLNMKAFFERGGLTLYSLDIPGEVGTVRVQM